MCVFVQDVYLKHVLSFAVLRSLIPLNDILF